MRLYDIEIELRELLETIGQSDGELSPEQELKLNTLYRDRDAKIRGCVAHIRNERINQLAMDGLIEGVEAELKRLKGRKAKMQSEEEKMLAYLGKCVPRGEEVNTTLGTIGWSRSYETDTSGVADIRKLPERFIRYKETYEPKKEELKKAILKEGITVEGVTVHEKWKLKLKD